MRLAEFILTVLEDNSSMCLDNAAEREELAETLEDEVKQFLEESEE